MSVSIGEIELHKPGTPVIVAGLISQVRNITVTRGRSAGSRMAVVELQDRLGSVEGVIFSEAFANCGELVQPNMVVIATGRVDERNGEIQLIVERLFQPDRAPEYITESVSLDLHAEDTVDIEQRVRMAAGTLKQAGGAQTSNGAHPAAVFLRLFRPDGVVSLKTDLRVIMRPAVLKELETVLGSSERIHLTARAPGDMVAPKRRQSYR